MLLDVWQACVVSGRLGAKCGGASITGNQQRYVLTSISLVLHLCVCSGSVCYVYTSLLLRELQRE